jgi:hypothetical protein
LKELYLDGCDKVTDAGLMQLVKERNQRFRKIPDFSNIYDFNALEFNRCFSSYFISEESMFNVAEDINTGGAHGLRVISLAECKNIDDSGIHQ